LAADPGPGEPHAGRRQLPAPARRYRVPRLQVRHHADRGRQDRGDHHLQRRPVPRLRPRAGAHDVTYDLGVTEISVWLRRGITTVAVGRVALGLTALAWPAVPARPWVGASADDLAAKVFGRALGARDVAL